MKSPPLQTIQLFSGNIELAKKYVAKCKEEMPTLLDKLSLCLDTQNAHEIANTAHSLKGQLSYLGAHELIDQAFELEQKAMNQDWSVTLAQTLELSKGISSLLAEL